MFEHDLSYLLEVLNIDGDETEEQLDERLKLEAKEMGVEVDDRQSLATQLSEYSRRSESIDSRASHSTGLTSHYSELSKEYVFGGSRRPSRPSLSFRDYDAFLSQGKPDGRHSISFSPTATPSHSTFSLPLSHPSSPESSPRRHFRRIRGLSMLRLHRADSHASPDGCPHCPQDYTSQRRAAHKLPCGHRLCTSAVRNTVRAATESIRGSVPSCCGKPIPGSVVEAVMTQEEQNALLDKLDLWDEAISLTSSVNTSRRISNLTQNALSNSSRATSSSGREDDLPPKAQKELERITALPEYVSLVAAQISQRDRFLAWASTQRHVLSERHEQLRTAMRKSHEGAAEDLAEHHAHALAEAEDKQVTAEADMRELHAREKISTATALKHMETYCAGVYSNGESHGRVITEQDLAQLEYARQERNLMPCRHESAINVLRGEQGRRICYRVQRQEREAQELVRVQRREELEFEREWREEVGKFEGSVEVKKKRVAWRWELECAMLAKKVGEVGGEVLRLPTAGWHVLHHAKESLGGLEEEVKVDSVGISTAYMEIKSG